jgi:hypothetical protein
MVFVVYLKFVVLFIKTNKKSLKVQSPRGFFFKVLRNYQKTHPNLPSPFPGLGCGVFFFFEILKKRCVQLFPKYTLSVALPDIFCDIPNVFTNTIY